MRPLAADLVVWFLGTAGHVVLLVGFILLAERLLRGILPPAWRYGLWCLVVVRLACPVVPASPVSPLGLARRTGLVGWPRGGLGKVFTVARADSPAAPASVAAGPRAAPSAPAADPVATVAWAVVPSLLAGVWLLGCVGLLARGLHGAAGFRRRLSQAREVRDLAAREALDACRARLGVRRRVRLVETDLVATPTLTGVLRPQLVLPVGLLDRLSASEREWVFLHEVVHLRRWDLAVDALLSLLQALHWPNPAVHLAARRLRDAREAACDVRVLALRHDGGGAAGYAETLLKLAAGVSRPLAVPAFVATVESSHRLEARLVAIRDHRAERRRQHLVGGLALAAVAVLGLTRAVEAPAAPAAPVAPEGLTGAAAEAAMAQEFARHPLVQVSGRFVEVRGSPAEVRQTLQAPGVPGLEEGSTTSAAVPLAPADAQRLLAELNRDGSHADILSTPKVTTLSGTLAILSMVKEQYFPRSWTAVERDGKTVAEAVYGQATDVGSVLEALPRLDAGRPGHVTLDLTARITEVGDPPWREETLKHTDAAGRAVDLPVRYANLDKWSVSTCVDLPAGHSVLLSGGTAITRNAVVKAVPVLGRLPGLGRWFRHIRYERSARARLVLVTLDQVGSAVAPAVPAP